MAPITRAQYERAYEFGRRVAIGLPLSDAVEMLASETGMNENSSRNYISFVECLLKGEVYERTIQYRAADYFMERVFESPDVEVRERACRVLSNYVAYYKNSQKVERPKVEEILWKWCGRG